MVSLLLLSPREYEREILVLEGPVEKLLSKLRK